MANRKPLIDEAGEVRELDADDLALFRPAEEVLSASLRKKLGVRGPQKAPTKERVTIRLSADVVARFRATGAGWQTRMDAALKNCCEPIRRIAGLGPWRVPSETPFTLDDTVAELFGAMLRWGCSVLV